MKCAAHAEEEMPLRRRPATIPAVRSMRGRQGVFDHVKFGVRDFQRSRRFYVEALAPVGVTEIADWPPDGAELWHPGGSTSLCLYQTTEAPAHLHIAFVAEHRDQVDAFYSAALAAGGQDNGAPGLRKQYSEHYYAAFVLDPDGHNIEVVCHRPEGR